MDQQCHLPGPSKLLARPKVQRQYCHQRKSESGMLGRATQLLLFREGPNRSRNDPPALRMLLVEGSYFRFDLLVRLASKHLVGRDEPEGMDELLA